MMSTGRRPGSRKIIFEGNSLLSLAQNSSTILNGHYIAQNVYLGLTKPFSFVSLAVAARTQTLINADISTAITPILRKGDIIFNWECTNDLNLNSLTGAQGYANLVTYANTVRALGAKLIVGTGIARDQVGDPVDLMTRIGDYNTLVRASSGVFDAICDLALDAMFDARADASNATNYTADKLHLATAGQTNAINLIKATINGIA